MRLILESSISRLLSHGKNHDCGTISAYLSNIDEDDYDLNDSKQKQEFNIAKKKELKVNTKKHRELGSKLRDMGYSVTQVKGGYAYEQNGAKKIDQEFSWFVVDSKDTGNLEKDLIKIGNQYNQESIIFQPKGKEPYLVWTRSGQKNKVGSKTSPATSSKYGKVDELGPFTKVGGRSIQKNIPQDYKMNEKTSTKYTASYDTVYESYFSKYTAAGFSKHDVVEISEDMFKDPDFQKLPDELKGRITDMASAQKAGDAIIAIANITMPPLMNDTYEAAALTLAYSQGGGLYYGQTTISGSLGQYLKVIGGIDSLIPKNAIRKGSETERKPVDMGSLERNFKSGHSKDIRQEKQD